MNFQEVLGNFVNKARAVLPELLTASSQVQALKAEIVSLKEQLAIALANDKADEESITTAQTEANMAKQELANLQAEMEASAAQLQDLSTLLDNLPSQQEVEISGSATTTETSSGAVSEVEESDAQTTTPEPEF